ncbi:uncharacterized protein LOC114279697 [Camellia sinensis]|uniref:uncharacterized protein LOC114279697 n=1 Tax=Camellia sinensis TaxID=4442 RepID=UPI0010365747|nr:uncharacterized protein LOC114279697 [Camellia sinensis]
MALDAWKQSDFLCRNYVLNSLADSLFNVFYAKDLAKELWDALDKKYKTEDAGAKKLVIGRFLDFKMADSKTVISQVQEFQVILHKIHVEGMFLSKSFQAVDCRKKKKPDKKYPPQNKSRAHMVEIEDLSQDVDDMYLAAVVSEVNIIGSNLKEWWMDTRATCHICAEKKMFTTFESISKGVKFFMKNSATSTVEGKGKVVLMMT